MTMAINAIPSAKADASMGPSLWSSMGGAVTPRPCSEGSTEVGRASECADDKRHGNSDGVLRELFLGLYPSNPSGRDNKSEFVGDQRYRANRNCDGCSHLDDWKTHTPEWSEQSRDRRSDLVELRRPADHQAVEHHHPCEAHEPSDRCCGRTAQKVEAGLAAAERGQQDRDSHRDQEELRRSRQYTDR